MFSSLFDTIPLTWKALVDKEADPWESFYAQCDEPQVTTAPLPGTLRCIDDEVETDTV